MSSNKQFKIQNGVGITGTVEVGGQLVIDSDGKVVLPAISDAVSLAIASSSTITDLQIEDASIRDYVDDNFVSDSDLAATNARTAGISVDSDSQIVMGQNLDMNMNQIKNVWRVYADDLVADRLDLDNGGTLNAKLGTVDFEGSTVNFGSANVGGLGSTINDQVDVHLNQSSAGNNEFLKWNGTDYEFTDYIQGRLATNQLSVDIGGSINAEASTLDFSNSLVNFSGATINGFEAGSVETDALTVDGDASVTGDLTLLGSLNLSGGINQYNVTDLDVADKTITVGHGQLEAQSGGSGIVVDGSGASMLWNQSNQTWDLNKSLDVTGDVNTSGLLKVGTNDTEYANNYIRFKPTGASYIDHSTVGQAINFRLSNASSLDKTVMTLSSAGNVGIAGQTTPTYNLDGGFADQTWGWYLNSSYNAGFTYNTTERSLLISTKSSENIDHIKFATGSASTERVRIDGEGNLALMTDGADIKLHYTEPRTFITNSGPSVTIKQIDNHAGLAYIDFAAWDNSSLMRLMNSGSLLVGKLTTDIGTQGIRLEGNNGKIEATRGGNVVTSFNRTGSDGTISEWMKDGTTIGSIGTISSKIYIGSDDTSLFFDSLRDALVPHDASTNAARSSAISLGRDVVPFKDLYLSGKVIAGAGENITPSITSHVDTDTGLFFGGADILGFSTGGAERARLDSAGRLGLGVTPEAWSSVFKVLRVGTGSSIAGESGGTSTWFNTNAYYDGSWKRINTNTAAQTAHTSDGKHEFKVAASGSANSAISWNTAMTVANSGDVLVGATASVAGARLEVTENAGNLVWFGNSSGTGLYMAAGGTAWVTSSDERVKDIIEPISGAIDKLSTLRTVIGKYKTDNQGVRRPFLIAQDLQAVFPEVVNEQEDELKTLGVEYSSLIPLLIAGMKEQQNLIESLTARVAALEE